MCISKHWIYSATIINIFISKFITMENLDKIKELVSDLGFDYQRMSQSGQETYDELCKLLKI